MKLYTIGFTGKNAATFFGLLRRSPPSGESYQELPSSSSVSSACSDLQLTLR